ncbi:MAG: hypothetical protein HN542_08135 [Flavobacteriales bacterium]|nr:hypothetical protein [Flavobacteriales bacterium]NCG30028.1 hypothetical protein [Bacteroidota bacterium]MBT4704269.1 hypothetical protein [Flavobacteriales bacterium]MBT4930575.1 hypothetical protein [Flavobacteriales bacterium]MBT5131850.1 hypothetical protein [Flavobacteriales bacterium]
MFFTLLLGNIGLGILYPTRKKVKSNDRYPIPTDYNLGEMDWQWHRPMPLIPNPRISFKYLIPIN